MDPCEKDMDPCEKDIDPCEKGVKYDSCREEFNSFEVNFSRYLCVFVLMVMISKDMYNGYYTFLMML